MKAMTTTQIKLLTVGAIVLVVAVLVLSIVLPIVLKRDNSEDRYNTKYNLVKTTQMNNFTWLNRTAEHGQVVLIGDSLTEIYNTGDFFTEFTRTGGKWVYNRGISGDTSDRMAQRLYDNALVIAPSVLVMLIGTNDVARGIPAAEIAANIADCIDQTHTRSPQTKIVLQAVYPVNHDMSKAARSMVGSRSNAAIAELNDLLRTLATQQNVTFLDLTKDLSDADGNLNAEYCYDGLHLNAIGFSIVTERLLPLLSDDRP